MALLIVRNLDEAVVRALKQRAAAHGRSAEEEHRKLLEQALLRQPRRSLKDLLGAIPPVGEDEDFARVDDVSRAVDL